MVPFDNPERIMRSKERLMVMNAERGKGMCTETPSGISGVWERISCSECVMAMLELSVKGHVVCCLREIVMEPMVGGDP